MEQQLSLKVDQYIYLKKTDSTNQYAQNIVSKSFPHRNYCIYTDNQTVGRGQIDRYWFSDVGKNLTASYLFKLNIAIEDQFDISIALALAVYDLCKDYMDPSQLTIKWPNDIYYGDQKLAGILIQNNIRGKNILNSILGVGINVNQKHFPEDLPNPVSLFQITGHEYDLLELVLKLEDKLGYRLAFMSKQRDEWRRNYFSLLYRKGSQSLYKRLQDNTVFEATIESITREGKLVLNTGKQKEVFNFREIQFII